MCERVRCVASLLLMHFKTVLTNHTGEGAFGKVMALRVKKSRSSEQDRPGALLAIKSVTMESLRGWDYVSFNRVFTIPHHLIINFLASRVMLAKRMRNELKWCHSLGLLSSPTFYPHSPTLATCTWLSSWYQEEIFWASSDLHHRWIRPMSDFTSQISFVAWNSSIQME